MPTAGQSLLKRDHQSRHLVLSGRRKRNRGNNLAIWRQRPRQNKAESDKDDVCEFGTESKLSISSRSEESYMLDTNVMAVTESEDNVSNTSVQPSEFFANGSGPEESGFESGSSDLLENGSPNYSPQSAVKVANTQISNTGAPSTCNENRMLIGRRIVDLDYIFQRIREIERDHKKFQCNFRNMVVVKEKALGLKSCITLKCDMCHVEEVIWTELPNSVTMDVNTAAVSGTISTGGAHAQLEENLSAMNIPCMSYRTFKRNHDKICEAWEIAASEEMAKAAKLEADMAIDRGDVDKDGVPFISVLADGSWGKRSYRTTYNSLSGMAAIIGAATKKVIYMGVKNKYCATCARASNQKKEVPNHNCFKNWGSSQSSASMEPEIVVEGFRRSMEMYGIRYTTLIADGDSSVYKRIIETKPYNNITVMKIECRNHLLRNYCRKIRDVCVISGKKNTTVLRKKVGDSVLRLRTAVKKAMEFRKKQEGGRTFQQRTEDLRKDILNSPKHVFGDHSKCAERGYFCEGKPKEGEKNLMPALVHTGLFEKIKDAVQFLCNNSRSLLYNIDTNPSEQYNSIIAKFIGGKRINYAAGRSYQGRCAGALVQHNTGKALYILNKTMYNASPGIHCKKTEERRKLKARNQKEYRKITVRRKLLYLSSGGGATDKKSYGSSAERPDMAEEDFAIVKEEILASLPKTTEQINEIQNNTILQSDSGEWFQERRNRLTASNFGKVCNMFEHTSCGGTVRSILKRNLNVESLSYGKRNEQRARRCLQEVENIDIKDCGLFIDEEYPFLGASPDGLVDDDGIVEIKCPSSAEHMTVDDAISNGKVGCWIKKKDGTTTLNKKHIHYFQVQGQLHITGRKYCLLAVWTPLQLKIERIERDDQFWETKMIPKLQKFYFNCLLPELVDPRDCRSMPIRDPPYIIEAKELYLKEKAKKKAEDEAKKKLKEAAVEANKKRKEAAEEAKKKRKEAAEESKKRKEAAEEAKKKRKEAAEEAKMKRKEETKKRKEATEETRKKLEEATNKRKKCANETNDDVTAQKGLSQQRKRKREDRRK